MSFSLLIRNYDFSGQVKEKGLLYFRKPDVNHEEGPEVADSLGVHGEGLGPDGDRIWLLWFGKALSVGKGTIENINIRNPIKSHEIWLYKHEIPLNPTFLSNFLHPVLPEFSALSGFKLAEGTMVTFRLYVDNLGAGALDVTMAWAVTTATDGDGGGNFRTKMEGTHHFAGVVTWFFTWF